jgi:hypothetical protein
VAYSHPKSFKSFKKAKAQKKSRAPVDNSTFATNGKTAQKEFASLTAIFKKPKQSMLTGPKLLLVE